MLEENLHIIPGKTSTPNRNVGLVMNILSWFEYAKIDKIFDRFCQI